LCRELVDASVEAADALKKQKLGTPGVADWPRKADVQKAHHSTIRHRTG
jgi:hypothetical protein